MSEDKNLRDAGLKVTLPRVRILEIFDKAEDRKETRTSIADKVATSLGVNCNRKLVRAVLDAKRSSKLEKLKKIS